MTKKEFDILLKECDITRKEFASYSGINYSTVTRWHDTERPIPVWVESWLENYKAKKYFDKIKSTLKATGVCDE
jgi:hypothetical protein